MKTRIFNLIIIDESGSMQSIKKATIDNVNETIQTIRSAQKKHEEQEHFVSLVTFNDDVKTVNDCVPARSGILHKAWRLESDEDLLSLCRE